MILRGPIRPDVAPELASIDPVAASEWFGYVSNLQPASMLAAALRDRGEDQLGEIIEAVERDPRQGWLVIPSTLLQKPAGASSDDGFCQQVHQWLRLKGVRISQREPVRSSEDGR
jgi:hypothetical protein